MADEKVRLRVGVTPEQQVTLRRLAGASNMGMGRYVEKLIERALADETEFPPEPREKPGRTKARRKAAG